MDLKAYNVEDNYLLNTEEELNEIVENAIDLGFSIKYEDCHYIEFYVTKKQQHNAIQLIESKSNRDIVNINEDSIKSLQDNNLERKKYSGVNLKFTIRNV